MRGHYFLIILIILNCSCCVIKTYKIDPGVGTTVEKEKKVAAILQMTKQNKNEHLNNYILNGEYLTLKMKKKNETIIDNLVRNSFCNAATPPSCGSIVYRSN